jgi:sulfur relay (sulfurtransferase) complex TusBCD TusD component (DsrE family)
MLELEQYLFVKIRCYRKRGFWKYGFKQKFYGNTLSLINAGNTDTSLFLWQNGVASGHFGFSSGSNLLRIVNATSDGLLTNAASINLTTTGNVGIGSTNPAQN